MNEGYTKVFVSLDGTEQQDFVLARAIKVAANNGAKLIIGHVIDSTALESAGSYPVDLVNGLEEAFKNSIAKQLEEAKANPNIPEVEVMIRAGPHSRDTQGRDARRCQARPGALRRPRPVLDQVCAPGFDFDVPAAQHGLRHLGREVGSFPPAQGLRGYHADVLAASRLRDVGLDNPSRPCAFVTVLQRVI